MKHITEMTITRNWVMLEEFGELVGILPRFADEAASIVRFCWCLLSLRRIITRNLMISWRKNWPNLKEKNVFPFHVGSQLARRRWHRW